MSDRRKPNLLGGLPGPEPALDIPGPRRSRDRGWEERQRQRGVVTYRGVPNELRDAVNEIAQEQHVSASDVARLLLEAGLAVYQRGEIPLDPVLVRGKLCLFPEDKAASGM